MGRTFSKLINRPWPHFYTTSRTPATSQPSLLQLDRLSRTPFVNAYAPLVGILNKLPLLSKARYASAMQEEGFNPVSASKISTSARRNCHPSGTFGSAGQPPTSHVKRTVRWSESDVFLGLFASVNRSITDMAFDLALPMTHDMRTQLLPEPHLDGQGSFHTMIKNLTRLSYASDFHVQESRSIFDQWHHTCFTMLQGATNLNELRLTIEQGNGQWDDEPWLFHTVANLELSNVHIVGTCDKPCSLPRARFTAFLEHHSQKLQKITLTNVTVNKIGRYAYSFRNAMLETMQC